MVDFNSLYPSIIRNFEICFTTVQRDLLEYDGGTNRKIHAARELEQADKTKDKPEEEEVITDQPTDAEVDYVGRIRNTRIEKVNGEFKEIDNNESPILARIVSMLIEKRKQVKGMLKDKSLSEDKRRRFDILQMAYKLTANSIYGCLGFPSSRFYSRTIADTVTGLGRQLLVQTKKKVEEEGYKVIYGDTDSIMINTESPTVLKAVGEAHRIKNIINKMFRKKTSNDLNEISGGRGSMKYNQKYKNKTPEGSSETGGAQPIKEEKPEVKKRGRKLGRNEGILQVGVDGVYKKLLLIKKKKYAGLMVTNWNEIFNGQEKVEKTKLEVKGLEIVRRDCSPIAKEACKRAIEIILHKENYLELIERHLTEYRRALDKFAKAFNHDGVAEENRGNRVNYIVHKVNETVQTVLGEKSANLQNSEQIEIEGSHNRIKEETANPEPKIEANSEDSKLPYDKIQLSLNSFVIKKVLNKQLRQYAQTQHHPHAQVAKYLIEHENKTETELIGRFIPYVVARSENKNDPIGKRAQHPSRIRKEGNKIDIEWYKNNQLKSILERSIGVVPNIDENFICRMLGLKTVEVIDYDDDEEAQTEPILRSLKCLPKYYRNILQKFGLSKSGLVRLFESVCSQDNCAGCSIFLNQCPKNKSVFTEQQVMLRAEVCLNNIIRAYSKALQNCIHCNSFEIDPIFQVDLCDCIKNKHKNAEMYSQHIQVSFYVYFMLFKLALISLQRGMKKISANQKTMGSLALLDYEDQVSKSSFGYLMDSVVGLLRGFRTNYLNRIVDLSIIQTS